MAAADTAAGSGTSSFGPRRRSCSENQLLSADGVEEQRSAAPGGVKRLGDDPAVIQLRVGNSAVEVAAKTEDKEHLLGPFH